MRTLDIFSTPISIVRSAIFPTDKELNIINSFNYEDKAHLNMFTKDYFVLNHLSNIKNQIEKYLKEYGEKVLGLKDKNQLYITNSWCVKTSKGGYHPSHSHPNSLISGVLYIDIGEKQGIVFEGQPAIFEKFNFLFDKNDTNYNSNKFFIPVSKNDLILFPSSLNHSVEINNTETTRLILGFNVFIKGIMGNTNYPTELNIL